MNAWILKMDLLLFVAVIAAILALHYLLWGKIYTQWYGKVKGLKRKALFAACLAGEALITILAGIYIFS